MLIVGHYGYLRKHPGGTAGTNGRGTKYAGIRAPRCLL
jgi:hypothetical protein